MPDVTALPQPGDIFAGKYLIERVIGSGKASLVFGARHCVTGKRFAIEWLLPGVNQARHDAVIDDRGDPDGHADMDETYDVDDQADLADKADRDSDDWAAAAGGVAGARGLHWDDAEEGSSVAEGNEPFDAEDLVSDAGDLDESEHRVIGHFQHPNVLEVYDVGEASGSLYTVMDWSEGESLEARIQRTGPMSVSEACRLLIPCMRGMHEAHAAGILHRDLKPSNIFICHATRTSPETVKVLDFEVADRASAEGDAASLVRQRGLSPSKPYYRAPELLGGLEIDHRADVYAFGAILYEVLSGRPPFAPMRHVNRDDITPTGLASLQARPERLPPGTEAIVSRAMARDVSQRFQTLHELAEALEAFYRPTPRVPSSGPTHYSYGLPAPHGEYSKPSRIDAIASPVADNHPISRNRPWPRPPSISEASEFSRGPAPASEVAEQRLVSRVPPARDHSQQREAASPRALPEWSETSSSRQRSEWSDATDPRLDRRATLPYSMHTSFDTQKTFHSGLPSSAPPAPVLRGKMVYIVSAIAVLSVGLILAYRFWTARETEVVASFSAVASPEVVISELEKPAPAPQPQAAPLDRQIEPTPELPPRPPASVPHEPGQDDPYVQELRAAMAAVRAEQAQLARASDPRSAAPADGFAAASGEGSGSNQAGPVYRLPLKAPNVDPARSPRATVRDRAAKPAAVLRAKPAPAASSPAPRAKAAPAPAADRHESSPAARSGDPLPMQLM